MACRLCFAQPCSRSNLFFAEIAQPFIPQLKVTVLLLPRPSDPQSSNIKLISIKGKVSFFLCCNQSSCSSLGTLTNYSVNWSVTLMKVTAAKALSHAAVPIANRNGHVLRVPIWNKYHRDDRACEKPPVVLSFQWLGLCCSKCQTFSITDIYK